jgi:glucosylceramidase
MSPSPSAPEPPQAPRTGQFSRRGFIGGSAALAAAAGLELARPAPASAAPRSTTPSGIAQVTWSSESTASGYEPKSSAWYADPATGLAGVAHSLSQRSSISQTPSGRDFGTVINVNAGETYQSILGIGSSMEDSTVHNLALMSPSARSQVLRTLFSPSKGAGFDLTRICFGTSDFSHGNFYSYDDGPADPTLSRFSIQADIDNQIIATLKEALRINPSLAIVGTIWSAPAWMKDNNSLIDGNLLDQYIPTLAQYFRMIVQAYAAQGIPIHAVTPQNEPGWPARYYPSMVVTSQQSKQLVNAIRAEFDAHQITTEVWAWDWNFGDLGTYATDVFGSKSSGYTDAYQNAKAIAWHDYSGDPSTMSQTKTQYPDLDMVLTERMWWGTSGADRIARYLRSWSTGYISWVTMLDQNRDTQHFGPADTTPLIQNPNDRNSYWALPEYYFFAQFSKFVQRGAQRIWSDYGSPDTVTTVAFLNPDGTVATVVINQSSLAQEFTLRGGAQQIIDTLPAKTVGTYVWTPAGAPVATDAYSAIQAEAYSDAYSVAVELTGDVTGGEELGHLANGSWTEYRNVNFDTQPATRFRVRVASGSTNTGQIEVRLDSLSNPPVAVIPVTSTGGWQSWLTKQVSTSGINGTHTVYLAFTSDQPQEFANVNWFTFTRDTGTDAYATIQAENFLNGYNVTIENTQDTSGNQDIGWIGNGSWAEYPDVLFGTQAATQFSARVASGVGAGINGNIEVRLDSLDNAPVGAIQVSDTGGWQTWTTLNGSISGITGKHTVYLAFTSTQGNNFVNVNWFQFAH